MSKRSPYRQTLPALELSIERDTDAVPADGAWYLVQSGRPLGRFRTLKQAKAEWDRVVSESGWAPERRPIDADLVRTREQTERWARNRAG